MKKHNHVILQRKSKNQFWIFGVHAVNEALSNNSRVKHSLLITKNADRSLTIPKNLPYEIVTKEKLDSLLGKDVVHQGVALLVSPLENNDISYAFDKNTVIILDQVTDPHNIGAILRSAVAFDIDAVIMPEDNSGKESATLAKTSCGAMEKMPVIRVPNLVRAIEQLKQNGFWCVGFDGESKNELKDFNFSGKNALVLGAEGQGMRRLTKENCDIILRISMSDAMESLNVSNAAAIVLYEAYKAKLSNRTKAKS